MENVGASCSSDPATSHSPSYQSPWLQRTLSDLDSKMKAMMTLLEDDGNLSTHRDGIYRKRISELKQMLEGFNTSYRSLAEKYDQLRSQSEHMAHSGKVQHTSNNRKSTAESLDNHKLEGCNFQPDSAAEDPDDECDGVDRGFEYLSKLADELNSVFK